ncbi:MAG: hypothetical protein J6B85_00275 [Lachnospiraceae bacterium]|nr:hypothetical protein [Lachnospiraceae bacterium]
MNHTVSYEIRKEKLVICYGRDIADGARVSGMCGKDPQLWILDYETQLPALCFYQVEVKTSI